MKYLLSVLFTVSTLAVVGQIHTIGMFVGRNKTTAFPIKGSEPVYSTARTSYGITYEYKTNNHVTIGAEFFYDQRGYEQLSAKNHYAQTIETIYFIEKFNFDYLSLPIKAGSTFGKKVYGFWNIGWTPAVLVKAEKIGPIWDYSDNIIGEKKWDMTKSYDKFDMSMLVEFGGGLNLKDGIWFYTSIMARLSPSITKRVCCERSFRHGGALLSVGMKFNLMK
ncbi:MAG: hypothetical protein RLZZ262_529 [Bacteroidota bacterium]|jgi:hypothetical protein